MNITNLKNAREQLLPLAGDLHVDMMLVTLNDLIQDAEASLPVVPTVEVGQVWRRNSNPEYWIEVKCVSEKVFVRDSQGDEWAWDLFVLTKHWTLHTPAPKPTPLTADDASDEVEEGIRRHLHDDVTYTNYTPTPEVAEVVEVNGIKVGSQWVDKNDSDNKQIVKSVDDKNNHVHWIGGGFDYLDTLRDYYKEEVALTADDIPESVWKATRKVINAYLAEKEKESGNG